MSSFTHTSAPYKRKRTMSQISNVSVSRSLSLKVAPKSITYVGPKKEVGGSGVQKAGSKGKGMRAFISAQKYVDMLFPPASFRQFNYGVNMYGNTGISQRTTNGEVGDLKCITSEPTRQQWVEFVGLPFYTPNLSSLQPNGLVGNKTVRTVQDLMYLSHNTKSGPQYSWATGSGSYVVDGTIKDNTGVAPIGQYDQPFSETSMHQRTCFIYQGGYQRHSFKNQSQAQCFIEVWECHPRERTFDWHVAASNHDFLTWHSVGIDVLHDLKVASANPHNYDNGAPTDDPFYPNGMAPTLSAYDQVTDFGVRINKNCTRTLTNYKVSKPIRVCLAPGETFEYTMKFPGFSFDNIEFAQLLENIYLTSGTDANAWSNIKVRPTSIPKFTKRLVFRFWGEQGASRAFTPDNPATTDVNEYAVHPGTVGVEGAVPVYLIHTQEEYHKCRLTPQVNTKYHVVSNLRDDAPTATNLLVVNDENDELIDPEL